MPEIPFKKSVPDYRTVVPGVWSDIQDAWIASFEGVNDDSEVRVNIKNLEAPLEQGRAKAYNKNITLTAGQSYAVKITPSTSFKVNRVNAKGFEIRFATLATGTTSDVGQLKNLNLSLDDSTPVFYESLSSASYSIGDVLVSGNDSLDIPMIADGELYVIISNGTSATITAPFSIIGGNRSALVGNFGITGDTQLIATTEMSTYNGAN